MVALQCREALTPILLCDTALLKRRGMPVAANLLFHTGGIAMGVRDHDGPNGIASYGWISSGSKPSGIGNAPEFFL